MTGSSKIPQFALGDVVQMKKQHPCGSDRWEVTRTGIDIGIKCLGCGRRVMIPRIQFEKAVKKRFPAGAGGTAGDPPGGDARRN